MVKTSLTCIEERSPRTGIDPETIVIFLLVLPGLMEPSPNPAGLYSYQIPSNAINQRLEGCNRWEAVHSHL